MNKKSSPQIYMMGFHKKGASGTYIFFEQKGVSSSGRTQIWQVLPYGYKHEGYSHASDPLGLVKWYGPWRTYAFFPTPNTYFEKTCLREIALFCELLTKKHKQNWRVGKHEQASDNPSGTAAAH
jgi:hypothetical protein